MSEIVRPLPGADAYAPEIAVEVRDRSLSPQVLRDIIEARVTLQEDEPAGFSLVLANSDPGRRGLSRSEQITPFKYTDLDLLDVKTPVVIQMGYAGRLRRMVVGEVVTFSPTFPQSGLSTLAITGNDFFQRLRNAKPGSDQDRAFHQKNDGQIAEAIARRHQLDPGDIDTKGPAHGIVNQKPEEDDLKFLLRRAQYGGYVTFITLDDASGRPKLHFNRPVDLRDDRDTDVFEYRWGESLLSFTPKISTVALVVKVTVRAWNPRKKKTIQYTAELKDLPRASGNGRAGAEVLTDDDFTKEERIVTRAVQSDEEAKRLAIRILEENAQEFITGNGEVMGDPDLRPGVVLRLAGLGRRFSGDYRLVKTEHVFSASGYVTSFEVKRVREQERPTAS